LHGRFNATKTMRIDLQPIAFVSNSRTEPVDDNWEPVLSTIRLADHIPTEALTGISEFSHLEIIYYSLYPLIGIFAQRKKDRPNKIGLTTVALIEHNERTIKVKSLDAIDGTPVLDIKPVLKESQPRTEIKQPTWAADLMKNYWRF
jgi:tRNA (adenine37-N6)-methyltransferase